MNAFLESLVSTTLLTDIFILSILLIRSLFKNTSKNSRLFLWALVGIKLITPFNLKSRFSLVPEKLAKNITVSSVNQTTEASLKLVAEAKQVEAELIFIVIWAVGVCLMLSWGAFSFFRIYRNVRDAVRKEENIFQSEKIVSPFVLGVFKPKIFLPFGIEGEAYSHIISHEKSHIKNFDHLIKITAFLLLAFYWYNPLVFICFKLLTKDIELACDERVVKDYSVDDRKSYAKTLLDCAIKERVRLVSPVSFGEVSIKGRVKSVISYKKNLKIFMLLFLCAALSATVCFGTVPEAKEKNAGLREGASVVIPKEEKNEPLDDPEVTPEVYEDTTEEPESETYSEIYQNDASHEEKETVREEIVTEEETFYFDEEEEMFFSDYVTEGAYFGNEDMFFEAAKTAGNINERVNEEFSELNRNNRYNTGITVNNGNSQSNTTVPDVINFLK